MAFQYTNGGLRSFPAAAAGVVVTPSATPWADSAWVEIIASAATDLAVSGATIAATTSVFALYIIEVGVGAIGVESPVAALAGLTINNFGTSDLVTDLMIPVDLIPAGSRVSVRLRKEGTSTATITIGLKAYTAPYDGLITTKQAAKANPVFTVAGSGVAWTDGAWATAIASTAGAAYIAGMTFRRSTNAIEFEVDVGVGAAASEVVVTTLPGGTGTTFWEAGPSYLQLFPVHGPIAASSRIALRMRRSTTNAGNFTFLIWYYEDLETDVVAALATSQAQKCLPSNAVALAMSDIDYDDASSWTELIASTATEIAITSWYGNHSQFDGQQWDFATGAAGSEVLLDTWNQGVSDFWGRARLLATVVPSGVRLSAQMRVNNLGSSVTLKIGYIENPTFAAQASTAFGYQPIEGVVGPSTKNSLNYVTGVVPNASAWADSAIVEIVDNTYSVTPWAITGTTTRPGAAPINTEYELEYLTGESGLEVVHSIYRSVNMQVTGGGGHLDIKFNAPLRFPASTRVSVRLRKSDTNTTGWTLWFETYGSELAEVFEAFELDRAFRGEDVALAWVEFSYQDAAGADFTYVWSGIALADPSTYYEGYKEERLILITDLIYALSDRFGRVQSTRASFELSDLPDTDTGVRAIGSFFSRTTGRVVRNVEVTIRLISDRGRRALETPVTVFRGVVDEVSSAGEYGIRFDCVSWLARRLDQPVVTRLIGEDFPAAPATALLKPVPIALGTLSDAAVSAAVAPVIRDDEAGQLDFYDVDRFLRVPGWGIIPGGGNPPTSLTPTENASAGELEAETYYFQAWSVTGGVESDPTPFTSLVSGSVNVTISDLSAITVSFAKGASADTTRVALGLRGPGTANEFVYFIQILETAGTSVQFTRSPRASGTARESATLDTITPGATVVNSTGFRSFVVTAVIGGQETAASNVAQALITPYNRPVRFAWLPVAGADEYAIYTSSWYAGISHPVYKVIDRRATVATTHINADGYPYFEGVHGSGIWDVVDGLTEQASGLIEPIYVGEFTDLTGRTVGGFLIAGHAGAVIDLYQKQDAASGAFDVGALPVTDAEYAAGVYMAPGKTGFSTYIGSTTYRTINSHRYLMVYVASGQQLDDAVPADGAASATRPLRANVSGAETVGDGSGSTVTSVYEQLRLLCLNLLLSDTPVLGENWVTTSPTFADGAAKLDETSVTDAVAAAALVITGGPAGARYLTEPITWRTLFADWAPSAKAYIGVSLQGPLRFVVINPAQAVELTVYEQHDILKGTFAWMDRTQGFANALTYQARPRYALSGVDSYLTTATLEHAVSQTRHGGERILDTTTLALTWRQSATIAAEVAQEFLEDSAYLPRTVEQAGVLSWVNFQLGSIIGVVHREGPASLGWEEARARKVAILGMRISVPANTVHLTTLDLRDQVGDTAVVEALPLRLTENAALEIDGVAREPVAASEGLVLRLTESEALEIDGEGLVLVPASEGLVLAATEVAVIVPTTP